MSLFGFGNIQFNVGQNSTRGPLQSLTENKYKTTTLRYPIDIGNVDKGHYMVIYIKKQAESRADENLTPTSFVEATNDALKNPLGSLVNTARDTVKGNFGGQLSTGIQNTFNQLNNSTGGIIGNLSSSVSNAFKTITGNLGNINNPFGQTNIINANGAVSQEINRNNIKSLVSSGDLVRNIKKTTRTNQVIALYMPDTLQFDFTQDYETFNLGDKLTGIVGSAVAETMENKKDYIEAAKAALKSLPAAIQQAASNRLGAIGTLGGFLATGAVVNPLLEVLYRSPQFRSFQYDFIFYPRDEREAVEVQKIINSLQYHQAPEFKRGSAGSLLIPPSEFEIEFFYSGKKNENLPKIGNCVLKSIQTNYAPNGFSVYEVPGQDATLGGTGMPVAIQMSLQFQEISYLTKNERDSEPASSQADVRRVDNQIDRK
jgi:hypothetical protein